MEYPTDFTSSDSSIGIMHGVVKNEIQIWDLRTTIFKNILPEAKIVLDILKMY